MSKYLNLAKKLKALAEQGVDGEKVNAKEMLEKLMLEHGISEDDLEGVERKIYWFRFEHRFIRLFQQTARSIALMCPLYKRGDVARETNSKTIQRGVELTVEQFVELEWKFQVYKAAWDDELDTLFSAFCMKHSVYHPDADKYDAADLTAEEKERLMRAEMMATGVKDRNAQIKRKQITNGPGTSAGASE